MSECLSKDRKWSDSLVTSAAAKKILSATVSQNCIDSWDGGYLA